MLNVSNTTKSVVIAGLPKLFSPMLQMNIEFVKVGSELMHVGRNTIHKKLRTSLCMYGCC